MEKLLKFEKQSDKSGVRKVNLRRPEETNAFSNNKSMSSIPPETVQAYDNKNRSRTRIKVRKAMLKFPEKLAIPIKKNKEAITQNKIIPKASQEVSKKKIKPSASVTNYKIKLRHHRRVESMSIPEMDKPIVEIRRASSSTIAQSIIKKFVNENIIFSKYFKHPEKDRANSGNLEHSFTKKERNLSSDFTEGRNELLCNKPKLKQKWSWKGLHGVIKKAK